MDLSPWNTVRDYTAFDKLKYAPAIDGAQFLRIGKDVIVNINSYNHYLGYLWVKSFLSWKLIFILLILLIIISMVL